jgi:HSP20 family protein
MGVFSNAPKSDVSETDKDYVIRTELPGMSEKDVEVSVNGRVITIKGEKRSERNEDKADYHLSECSYGSFQRSFHIPEDVNVEKVKAEFDSGVLTLTLAKDQKTVTKKITVKTKGE